MLKLETNNIKWFFPPLGINPLSNHNSLGSKAKAGIKATAPSLQSYVELDLSNS
jgi:hypothetical protein